MLASGTAESWVFSHLKILTLLLVLVSSVLALFFEGLFIYVCGGGKYAFHSIS